MFSAIVLRGDLTWITSGLNCSSGKDKIEHSIFKCYTNNLNMEYSLNKCKLYQFRTLIIVAYFNKYFFLAVK